eukprot:CFRG7089T1
MTVVSHKICAITGPTSGIGEATALALAQHGFELILICRNTTKGEKLAVRCEEKGASKATVQICDLSSLDSVRAAAQAINNTFERIDILINNAAIFTRNREITVDGLESMFATNHLGPFLLTNLLLPLLQASGREIPGVHTTTTSSTAPEQLVTSTSTPASVVEGGRIINVASDSYSFVSGINFDDLGFGNGFSAFKVYGHSKLCNIMFTRQLTKRLEGRNSTGTLSYTTQERKSEEAKDNGYDLIPQIVVNALHPGAVSTNLGAQNGWYTKPILGFLSLFFRTPAKGAASSIYLATNPEGGTSRGGYFYDCKSIKLEPVACDDVAAEKLWEISAKMIGADCTQDLEKAFSLTTMDLTTCTNSELSRIPLTQGPRASALRADKRVDLFLCNLIICLALHRDIMDPEFIDSLPAVAKSKLKVFRPILEDVLKGTYASSSASERDTSMNNEDTLEMSTTSARAMLESMLVAITPSRTDIRKHPTAQSNTPPSSSGTDGGTGGGNDLYCAPCKKKFSSRATLKTHEGSAKHKKETKKHEDKATGKPKSKAQLAPQASKPLSTASMTAQTSASNVDEKLSELVYMHEHAKLMYVQAIGGMGVDRIKVKEDSCLAKVQNMQRGLVLFWNAGNGFLILDRVQESAQCLIMVVVGVDYLRNIADMNEAAKGGPGDHTHKNARTNKPPTQASTEAPTSTHDTRTPALAKQSGQDYIRTSLNRNTCTSSQLPSHQPTHSQQTPLLDESMVIVSDTHERVRTEALLLLARLVRPYSHKHSSAFYQLYLERYVGKEKLNSMVSVYSHRDVLLRMCAEHILAMMDQFFAGRGSTVGEDVSVGDSVQLNVGMEAASLHDCEAVYLHSYENTKGSACPDIHIQNLTILLNTLNVHKRINAAPSDITQSYTYIDSLLPTCDITNLQMSLTSVLQEVCGHVCSNIATPLGVVIATYMYVLVTYTSMLRQTPAPTRISTATSLSASSTTYTAPVCTPTQKRDKRYQVWSLTTCAALYGALGIPYLEAYCLLVSWRLDCVMMHDYTQLVLLRKGFRNALTYKDGAMCVQFENAVSNIINASTNSTYTYVNQEACASDVYDLQDWLDEPELDTLDGATQLQEVNRDYMCKSSLASTQISLGEDMTVPNICRDGRGNDSGVCAGAGLQGPGDVMNCDIESIIGELRLMRLISVASRTYDCEWFDSGKRFAVQQACDVRDETLVGIFDLHRRGSTRIPFPAV